MVITCKDGTRKQVSNMQFNDSKMTPDKYAEAFCKNHGGVVKKDVKQVVGKNNVSDGKGLDGRVPPKDGQQKPLVNTMPTFCGKVIQKSVGRKCIGLTKAQKDCQLKCIKGKITQ